MLGQDRNIAKNVRSAAAQRLKALPAQVPVAPDVRLADLTGLASAEIETAMVHDLGATLNVVFGGVCEKPLPIYFGPLLGRLYLEGL